MRLTADQRRMLRLIPPGGLYEGAFPLYTDLSERRCRVVRNQLAERGMIYRRPGTATWFVSYRGEL